jgi:hypothetical protein
LQNYSTRLSLKKIQLSGIESLLKVCALLSEGAPFEGEDRGVPFLFLFNKFKMIPVYGKSKIFGIESMSF